LSEPAEINLSEPAGINFSEPAGINMSEPAEINLSEPVEINYHLASNRFKVQQPKYRQIKICLKRKRQRRERNSVSPFSYRYVVGGGE